MKRILFFAIFGLYCLLLPTFLAAQNIGNIPGGTGTGGTGNGGNSGGSTGGTGSGSSNSTSSSTPSTGVDSSPTALEGTTETPTFQGFQSLGTNSFVGVNSAVPFIGVEQSFDASTSVSSKRQTSTNTQTRRTTSSRTSSSRTSMSRTSTGYGSTSSNRTVRAATTTDFAFSPMQVEHRETSFRTRMARLPNFKGVPDQVEISVGPSQAGTLATLKGTVPTQRDRKLIAQLILLEPGIDKVQNDLVVADNADPSKSVPKLDPAAP